MTAAPSSPAPRALRPLALALVLAAALAPAAGAGEEWKKEKSYQALIASEAKILRDLLRSAMKEDYRRQAWYLAGRLLAVDPKNGEAQAAMGKWSDQQLQEGMVPKAAWLAKRTKQMEEVGNQYARFAELLTGAGVEAEDFYPVNVRSRAYGATYGPAVQAFEQEGYVWLGTFGDGEKKPFEEALGPLLETLRFPPEFDDEYLGVKIRWPEARTAALGSWRFTTDAPALESMRMVAAVDALEKFLVDELGSEMKKPPEEPTEFMVFQEAKTYDRVASEMIRESEREDFKDSSSHFSGWPRPRVFVLWRHRANAWIGEDAVLLGAAAPILAQQHLAPGTSTRVNGRGSWLLHGLAGACQGFARGGKGKPGAIDPARCWLLAVARVLKEQGDLVPWDELLEMDEAKADALPRKTVKVSFAGGSFEAKDVDVVHAQATAFALGIWRAENGKGARRLAKLLHDLFQRDSLPDLDKTLGWKKGRAFEEAESLLAPAPAK